MVQFNLALASACCAVRTRSAALACFCLVRSAVKASAALSLDCFNALIRAAEGVSGWMGLIVLISCMRMWYLCAIMKSTCHYRNYCNAY